MKMWIITICHIFVPFFDMKIFIMQNFKIRLIILLADYNMPDRVTSLASNYNSKKICVGQNKD